MCIRDSSYGLNYQKTGKELMSQDEIAVMDGAKCCLLYTSGDKSQTSSLDEQLKDIDFALQGEVHDLTDAEKQDILDYIKSVSYTHLDVYKRQIQSCMYPLYPS